MQRRAKAAKEAATRAAVYVRVSTEDQAVNGVSLEMQEERLRDYCKARSWQVAGVYCDDGVSAKTLNRPALAQLMDDAKAKRLDAVLVFKLDRLTRSLRDLLALVDLFEKRGIALASLSENLDISTETGRMVLRILGVFAQWEREVTGGRIAAALRHKRSHLEAYGPPPLGFSRAEDGRLEPVEGEMRVVRRVYALRRRRGMSLRAIADSLNEDGVPTKNGRRWHVSTLQYLLHNDLYVPFVPFVGKEGARR